MPPLVSRPASILARYARGTLVALVTLCSACAADPTVVTIEITTGHESDAFSRDPAVTQVSVKGIAADGSTLASATTEPGGSFALGEVAVEELIHIEVTGTDSSNTVRARGRSPGLVIGTLVSEVWPVFAQRLGEWARPPGQLSHSHVGGLGAVIGERLLLLTGGQAVGDDSDGAVAFYDLLALGGTTGGTLTRVPKSVVVASDGNAALFIDDTEAVWLDFAAGDSTVVEPPSGLTGFDQVAGGKTVVGPESSYVVGATRADPPSDRVLIVKADRSLASASLTALRHHAAATWVPDIGLAVAGGSDGAAGVEVLAAGATAASIRPFEPDPVTAAGAVTGIAGSELVLLCGLDGDQPAPVRSLNLDCVSDCAAVTLDIVLPSTLTGCDAYATDEGQVLLVGHDTGDSQVRAFAIAIAAATATELPLREPRIGAVPVPAPNGTLALLGGEHPDGTAALTVELLFP